MIGLLQQSAEGSPRRLHFNKSLNKGLVRMPEGMDWFVGKKISFALA
jgi:hypothetical protein